MSTEITAQDQATPTSSAETTSQTQVTQTQAEPVASEVKPAEGEVTQSDAQAEVKYDLKLAEDSLLDPERVSEIEAFAKANKLTNEQAQTVLEHEHKAIQKFYERQADQMKEQSEAWRKDIENSKELGRENLNKSIEFAKRGASAFASKELRELMEMSSIGNHPEVFKMFVAIGKAMADDKITKPGAMAREEKNYEEIFYGAKN